MYSRFAELGWQSQGAWHHNCHLWSWRTVDIVRLSSVTSHEVLMARFQRGLDTRAFGQIVSHYTGPALGVAQQILSDRVLAEDAVQEAFLRVVRCRDQYEPSRAFSSWFYTILRNICTDMLRQRTRHIKAVGEIADWSKPATQNPEPSFNAQELLQSLPASEQAVLSLRIIHDMPFRDIATVVGISTEAAKKRAQRGLRALREKMRDSERTIEKTDINALANKSSDFLKTTSPNRPTKRT